MNKLLLLIFSELVCYKFQRHARPKPMKFLIGKVCKEDRRLKRQNFKFV